MHLRSKNFFLIVVLTIVVQYAFCQEPLPVFKKKSDSTAYYANQEAMRRHDPLSGKRVRMDSLWDVQQLILKNGILGWKYTYRPNETFVPFEDLSRHRN